MEQAIRYMTVTLDIQPEGFNLTCWMTSVPFWTEERVQFPYNHMHIGNNCTWFVHANVELSMKILRLVVDEADSICTEQTERNNRRKLANR